jgi:hypothetical protein
MGLVTLGILLGAAASIFLVLAWNALTGDLGPAADWIALPFVIAGVGAGALFGLYLTYRVDTWITSRGKSIPPGIEQAARSRFLTGFPRQQDPGTIRPADEGVREDGGD